MHFASVNIFLRTLCRGRTYNIADRDDDDDDGGGGGGGGGGGRLD